LSVRQFTQGLMDMAKDATGLSDHLLYRLLYTPQLLNSHAHSDALPAYFDVSFRLINLSFFSAHYDDIYEVTRDQFGQ